MFLFVLVLFPSWNMSFQVFNERLWLFLSLQFEAKTTVWLGEIAVCFPLGKWKWLSVHVW
jgi:hypothetical protein